MAKPSLYAFRTLHVLYFSVARFSINIFAKRIGITFLEQNTNNREFRCVVLILIIFLLEIFTAFSLYIATVYLSIYFSIFQSEVSLFHLSIYIHIFIW